MFKLIHIASIFSMLFSCNSNSKKENIPNMDKANLYKGKFGTCCKELKDAFDTSKVPNTFFRIEKNNTLYLTVGYINTESGPGYFDQALIYCPFCGQKLQDKEEIKVKSSQ